MEKNLFYVDKVILYISKNINKLPNIYNPNEPMIKNFINTCCGILVSTNIQIFVIKKS